MTRFPILVMLAGVLSAPDAFGQAAANDGFDDLLVSERTIQNFLESPTDDRMTEWLNPNSGTHGKIEIKRSGTDVSGRPCIEYTNTWFVAGASSTTIYQGIRCRDTNGRWRVAGTERASPGPIQLQMPSPPPPDATVVRRLQYNLKMLVYFDGDVTGVYNDATRAALKRFIGDERLNVQSDPNLTAMADYAEQVLKRTKTIANACAVQPAGQKVVACGSL